ncbi:FKBP65 [Symbiodinium natans]|uniref:peptidylprolyl isomerase n=1 Tax=Symbiodinium natans TaxID=878477 RepID=A0A812HZT9_9DINO|nr:FKBP65 [Symbiodinium natans]
MDKTKNAMSPEEQLEDLQRRFTLLEGERKATYETAKLNIQQNKEIITQMKEENKTLRNQIAEIRIEKPESLEKSLEKTMTEVQNLQRRIDLVKNENNKKREYLDQSRTRGCGRPTCRNMDTDVSDDGVDFPLPEGVKKEILSEAASSDWAKPREGDEVTVHYVGTLESGEQFANSRDGEALTFLLGRGEAVKAWDLGIPTMRKGEVAKFKVAPEFAYGPEGSEKVPPNSAVTYEIELVSWRARLDLFSDGTVIKTVVQEGSGWKMARMKDEVCLSLKVERSDGTTFYQVDSFEYVLGSDLLGPWSKAADRALVSMKRGGLALLHFAKTFDCGAEPQELSATLTLHQIYETSDISFKKDKTLLKKQIVEGEGHEKPKDGSKVRLRVELAADAAKKAIPCFEPQVLEFVAGEGEVTDAFEFCTAEMKKEEKAELRVQQPAQAAEPRLGLENLGVDEVLLTLVLEDFEPAKHAFSLSPEEKMERAASKKDTGTKLFKAQRWAMATKNYQAVSDMLSYMAIAELEGEAKSKAENLKLTCNLNSAACLLKLQCFNEAKAACELVLEQQGDNLKALFRRAQAEIGLKNFVECIADCKRVLQLDADNRDAKLLLRQAATAQKEATKKSKEVYASMFGAGSADAKASAEAKPTPKAEPRPRAAATATAPPAPGLLGSLYQHVAAFFHFWNRLAWSGMSTIFGRLMPRLRDRS